MNLRIASKVFSHPFGAHIRDQDEMLGSLEKEPTLTRVVTCDGDEFANSLGGYLAHVILGWIWASEWYAYAETSKLNSRKAVVRLGNCGAVDFNPQI